MNPEGVHVSFASDPLLFISLYRLLKIIKAITYTSKENLHKVSVQTAKRQRWRHDVYNRSNHIGEIHGFYDVKYDHVTSRDTMLFMEV